MYTVVQKPNIPGHRKRADLPPLEVFDHRKKHKEIPYEDSYEKLRIQKEALQDAEIRYQKRIHALENEAVDIAKAQEATQTENKSLKNFLDRGPKAASIRKARKENNQLQDVINKLHDENKDLVLLINRMEKRGEDEWQNVFEETRRRQEERYSVVGPFVAGLNGKKTTITLNDVPSNKASDSYDKQLERHSKQAKTLLHKFEQMKRMKGSIDYATVMGPRMCTQNVYKHRAVAEKVNMDLNKYSARLEELTCKHEKMTDDLITSIAVERKKKVNTGKKATKKFTSTVNSDANESQKPATIKPYDTDTERNTLTKGSTEKHDNDIKGTSRIKTVKKGSEPVFITELPLNEINASAFNEENINATESNAKEQRGNKLIKARVNYSTPNKSAELNTANTAKASNYSKNVKSASSSNSKGILRGKENTRRDETVRFNDDNGTNDGYFKRDPRTTIKSTVEDSWDQQREKMRETRSGSRRRPASKSASTARRKSVDTVKSKSELDNYKDDGDEESPLITRGKKKTEIMHSDRPANRPTRVMSRSPLVHDHKGTRLVTGNEYLHVVDNTRIGLTLNARKHRQLNNYINDESPGAIGRYSNGPEPTTETQKLLSNLEGPDSKPKIIRSKIDSGAKYRQAKKRSNTDNYDLMDGQTADVHGIANRSESKVRIGTKVYDSKYESRSAKSSAKSPRTFPKHPPISKHSVHLEKEPNSGALLHYLKHNTGGSPVDFSERFMDKEDHVSSPFPVTFRNDARTLRQQNVRFVTRTDQMRSEVDNRREQFYRSYLNET